MSSDNFSRMTDAELLRRARKESAAFREFYGRHAIKLDAWLSKCVSNKDIGAELTAETFAQAWLGLKKFNPDRAEDGAGWLYGIGRNLVRQYYRKERVDRTARKKLGVLEETVVDERIESLTFASVDPDLRSALGDLPEHEREAVKLRVVGELSYKEVAELLDCTETAARIRVSRALKTMRETLGDRADIDELRLTPGRVASEHA